MLRQLIPLFAVAAIFAGATAPAVASADLGARVQALAAKSTTAKLKAISELAATGAPGVARVLQSYLDRELYTLKSSGRIVQAVRGDGGYVLKDPLSLKPLGTVKKSTLDKIRMNNRLRRKLRAALGGLSLSSTDPAARRKAAETLFRAPRADRIDALRQAVAGESDGGVRSDLIRALAATELLHGASAERRIAAAKTLRDYAELEVSALLGRAHAAAGTDGAVRQVVASAKRHVDGRIEMWGFAGKLFQGLSLASVLLLAAIGLAITFGVMGVINMAHGEMVMLGAYTTFVVQELFRAHFPDVFGASLLVAIPAAFLVAGAIGVAVERGIIRYLYGRPLETLLATWGLSLVLQQLVRTVFGPTNREVGNPSFMSGAFELPGGVLLTYNRVWIIVFSLLVLGLLVVILRRTALGLQMRAVTQNRRMASAMGIRTGRVDALTFGLGSGIAGIAGVALSQIDNVSPNLGQAYIVDSFMVVVFGGVGNLLGTLLGATTLGIANKLLEAWSGAVLAKILILVAVILFIQRRPRGLFALKGRASEA